MLSELAQAVRIQAQDAGEALEALRTGILALQFAMGEGNARDLSADSPLAVLNDCYTRTAKMCIAVSGLEDPDTGKTLKRGLSDDVHSATTWILGDAKQPALPGTRVTDYTIPASAMKTLREGAEALRETVGEGGTVTISAQRTGLPPVTLHGKAKEGDDVDG